VTRLRWAHRDGWDGKAEYLALKAARPIETVELAKAIGLILKDPGAADELYAIRLADEYRATPYLRTLGDIRALTWRELPELDAVEVQDFDQRWLDLPFPRIWPRD
jgi:hypothetical protein